MQKLQANKNWVQILSKHWIEVKPTVNVFGECFTGFIFKKKHDCECFQ